MSEVGEYSSKEEEIAAMKAEIKENLQRIEFNPFSSEELRDAASKAWATLEEEEV